jgi:hypothetical protein
MLTVPEMNNNKFIQVIVFLAVMSRSDNVSEKLAAYIFSSMASEMLVQYGIITQETVT